jgi:hypothetical protein
MIAHDEPRPSCHIYINITLIFTIFRCSSDIKSNHCFTFSSFALLFDMKKEKRRKKCFNQRVFVSFHVLSSFRSVVFKQTSKDQNILL